MHLARRKLQVDKDDHADAEDDRDEDKDDDRDDDDSEGKNDFAELELDDGSAGAGDTNPHTCALWGCFEILHFWHAVFLSNRAQPRCPAGPQVAGRPACAARLRLTPACAESEPRGK